MRTFHPRKHILHVGRRVLHKNLDTMIRAVALLSPEYSCIFVGGGKREAFVALAESLGVTDRCFWLDSIENSGLPLWYSAGIGDRTAVVSRFRSLVGRRSN